MIRLSVVVSIVLFAFFVSASDKSETDKFHSLLEQERDWYYSINPDRDPKRSGYIVTRYPDMSEKAYKKAHAKYEFWLAELAKIDRASLSKSDQVNYDLFGYIQKQNLLTYEFKSFRNPFYSDSGFHTWALGLHRNIRFTSYKTYLNYLSRLKDLPNYFNVIESNLKVGLKEGFTMPQVVLDGLMPTFGSPIVENVEDSAFYTPFKNITISIDEQAREKLRENARKVIMEKVIPAYKKLNDFMVNVYHPNARKELAARSMPRGEKYYPAMVKYYTTMDVTPDQVHALGLAEVARIRSEMEEIVKQVGFDGSFADFLNFLRTDDQFYAKSEKELIMFASYVAKKIDGRLPKLFKHLPRQPYGVEAVPTHLAPNYTTGRYLSASKDAPRGGYYWVNTYNLKQRPLYNIPALTLHEGMPGHHLQIALSAEMENVPAFRKGYYPHAFGEGWGLYAEKLGLDMDIYETPYEQFGRLSYEMWRACRLVVDTGIHWKGWTRDQAIKLMEENSALSKHNIRTEVDRYIAWPGQALAYKMGELKILELRERAKKALGDDYDIREFHNQVVSEGGMPMTMLEAKIDKWIKDSLTK